MTKCRNEPLRLDAQASDAAAGGNETQECGYGQNCAAARLKLSIRQDFVCDRKKCLFGAKMPRSAMCDAACDFPPASDNRDDRSGESARVGLRVVRAGKNAFPCMPRLNMCGDGERGRAGVKGLRSDGDLSSEIR